MLLVEDSPEDREATIRALRKAGLANPINCCTDGEDALAYLFQRGRYADAATAPRPDLILLDLNMPGTDGREVLAEIKQSEALKSIPVIVLTTSTDDRDIQELLPLGREQLREEAGRSRRLHAIDPALEGLLVRGRGTPACGRIAVSTATSRILVVDDSPEDRLAYRRWLQADAGNGDFVISEAGSGDEGLRQLSRNETRLRATRFSVARSERNRVSRSA